MRQTLTVLGLEGASLIIRDDEGKESRRLAFAPATATDDPAVDYGFGWRITGESTWHSGETKGFRNVIVRFSERRMTVVILTNRNEGDPLGIAKLHHEQFHPHRAK